MQVSPEKTIFYMFMGTVFISAFIVRVFELPYFRVQKDKTFDSYFTAIWFTVITLTTIGYGDISPGTMPGQLFTILLAFWGSLLLSLVVVVLTNIFELSESEKIALAHLKLTR